MGVCTSPKLPAARWAPCVKVVVESGRPGPSPPHVGAYWTKSFTGLGTVGRQWAARPPTPEPCLLGAQDRTAMATGCSRVPIRLEWEAGRAGVGKARGKGEGRAVSDREGRGGGRDRRLRTGEQRGSGHEMGCSAGNWDPRSNH